MNDIGSGVVRRSKCEYIAENEKNAFHNMLKYIYTHILGKAKAYTLM